MRSLIFICGHFLRVTDKTCISDDSAHLSLSRQLEIATLLPMHFKYLLVIPGSRVLEKLIVV
jgi:hypothetical protein